MPEQLSEEQKAIVSIVVLVIISLAMLVLAIKIAIIHFFQDMFWIFLTLVPIFFILFIIFLLWGIFKKEEDHNYWYSEPSFFERPIIFIFALGFILLAMFSVLGMAYSYERGYSDVALDKLAKYENQLQSLQQLRDIFTGQIIWDIQNQAIEETITSLCNDPNYPCDQVKQSYETYKAVKGAKDSADEVAGYLGLIEKANG